MGSKMTFFRAFQGWTALTASGPGDGTLTLLPNVKVYYSRNYFTTMFYPGGTKIVSSNWNNIFFNLMNCNYYWVIHQL